MSQDRGETPPRRRRTIIRRPRLKKEQVEYLALEGGGGKGNAFMGAVDALEELHILRYDNGRQVGVRGVAGASAGAITALLLSCGYDRSEIERFLKRYQFNDFFDPPDVGLVPRLGGCRREPRKLTHRVGSALNLLELYKGESLILRVPTVLSPGGALTIEVLNAVFNLIDQAIIRRLPDPLQKLLRHPRAYRLSLIDDLGIFSGCKLRAFFDTAMRDRIKRKGWRQPAADITFNDHLEIFRVKFAVTGVNLETGKSELFSQETTPGFPVADAVRISMSLPYIYKPVVIRRQDLRAHVKAYGLMQPADLEGVWVDGGTLNNLPIHAFDDDPGKTLGIRLGLPDQPRHIATLEDEMTAHLQMGFFGTGESSITDSWKTTAQSIVLDPSPLGLLDFQADLADLRVVVKRAKEQTLRYFQ